MKTIPVGQFLLEMLYRYGVEHIYGVPGDAITGIREFLNRSHIKHYMTAREETAGWAAEVYGRTRKLGAVYATYNAGTNQILNPMSEGVLHNSAFIIIGGEPSMEFRAGNYGILHHHQIHLNDFDDQRKRFANELKDERRARSVTDLGTAAYIIVGVIGQTLRDRLPGYLGMPADMWTKEMSYNEAYVEDLLAAYTHPPMEPRKDVLDNEIIPRFKQALAGMVHPLLFTGHALENFGLLEKTITFAERLNVSAVSAFNGFGGFPPDHPLFIGTYDGPASVPPDIRKFTESSDLIVIGLLDTDLNYALQLRTVQLPAPKIIIDPIHSEVRIGEWSARCNPEGQKYLLARLTETAQVFVEHTAPPLSTWIKHVSGNWEKGQKKSDGEDPITVADIAPIIGRFLKGKDVPLVFDVGDPMLIALGILPSLTQITYTSNFAAMGIYTGCIGLEHATGKRPLAIVGDGAFGMGETYSFTLTGTAPMAIVFNNGGYLMMRQFGGENKETEKGKGSDSLIWPPLDFHPDCRVGTPREFEHALFRAAQKNTPFIIEIVLDSDDKSEQLRNFKDMER